MFNIGDKVSVRSIIPPGSDPDKEYFSLSDAIITDIDDSFPFPYTLVFENPEIEKQNHYLWCDDDLIFESDDMQNLELASEEELKDLFTKGGD